MTHYKQQQEWAWQQRYPHHVSTQVRDKIVTNEQDVESHEFSARQGLHIPRFKP